MIERLTKSMTNLISRLPDTYKKDPEGNISKLVNIFEHELKEVRFEIEGIQRLLDVDQAKGWRLDIIGRNFDVRRRGLNDADYRYLIQLQILSNMSPGDISTLNRVGQFFLGDSYIKLQETWGEEPASFEVHYDYMQLFDKVRQEHDDGTIDEVRDTLELATGSLEEVRGAGISLILLPEIDSLDHTVDRAESLYRLLAKDLQNTAKRQQQLEKTIQKQLVEDTLALLDGSAFLNGSRSLDGFTDRMTHTIFKEIAKTLQENRRPQQALTKDVYRTVPLEVTRQEELNKDMEKEMHTSKMVNNPLDGATNLDGSFNLDGERELLNNALQIEVV